MLLSETLQLARHKPNVLRVEPHLSSIGYLQTCLIWLALHLLQILHRKPLEDHKKRSRQTAFPFYHILLAVEIFIEEFLARFRSPIKEEGHTVSELSNNLKHTLQINHIGALSKMTMIYLNGLPTCRGRYFN